MHVCLSSILDMSSIHHTFLLNRVGPGLSNARILCQEAYARNRSKGPQVQLGSEWSALCIGANAAELTIAGLLPTHRGYKSQQTRWTWPLEKRAGSLHAA